MGGRLRARVLEEKQGEGPDCRNDISKLRPRRQQSQKHEQSLDCQRLSKGINSDHQCRKRDAHSKQEACNGGLQQGKDSPQLHQPNHNPQQSVIRRGRRRGAMEIEELQPSR